MVHELTRSIQYVPWQRYHNAMITSLKQLVLLIAQMNFLQGDIIIQWLGNVINISFN